MRDPLARLDSVLAKIAKLSRRMRALEQSRADAEWNESDHPRAEDGKFGSGGGGSSGPPAAAAKKSGQPPKVSKGIYYFPTFQAAREHAEKHGLPADRIIGYEKGHAVQLAAGGDYAGPGKGHDYTAEPKPARTPKPVSELSGSELAKRHEKLSAASSAVTTELIEAGRGHERFNETMAKDDPIAKRFRKIHEELRTLSDEKEARRKYHGSTGPIKRK